MRTMFKQNIIAVSKCVVVVALLFVFLYFFGLKSLKTYQEKVLVAKSDKPQKFIPPPAITICPSNIEYAFPIFSIKERHKMRENWDSVFEYLCGLVI